TTTVAASSGDVSANSGSRTATLAGNLIDPQNGRWRVPNTNLTGTNASLPGALVTNLTLQNSEVLPNDFTLTGNLTVNGADLNLNGHTVIVNGGFTVNSNFAMQNPNDLLRVTGSILFNGNSTSGRLTAGVLEAQGNFTVLNSVFTAYAPSG